MIKHLWDNATAGPQVSAQVDFDAAETLDIVAAASVPSDKRIVPIWMLWWWQSTGDAAYMAITIKTTTPTTLSTMLETYTVTPRFSDFGGTFINACANGAGLQLQTQELTNGTLSVVMGYYII